MIINEPLRLAIWNLVSDRSYNTYKFWMNCNLKFNKYKQKMEQNFQIMSNKFNVDKIWTYDISYSNMILRMLTTSNISIIASYKKCYSIRTQSSDHLYTSPACYSMSPIAFYHWVNLHYLIKNIKSVGLEVWLYQNLLFIQKSLRLKKNEYETITEIS
jgi:hypothetical protein